MGTKINSSLCSSPTTQLTFNSADSKAESTVSVMFEMTDRWFSSNSLSKASKAARRFLSFKTPMMEDEEESSMVIPVDSRSFFFCSGISLFTRVINRSLLFSNKVLTSSCFNKFKTSLACDALI